MEKVQTPGKIDTSIKMKPAYVEELWCTRKEQWNKTRVYMLIISLLAIGMSVFHIYTAGFGTLPSWEQRSIHVIWALVLIFLLFPFKKGKNFGAIDILFVAVTLTVGVYVIFGAEAIQP